MNSPTRVSLKGGKNVTLRLKTPQDGDALGAMLERCSAQTYHYFHPYPLNRASGRKVAHDRRIYCFVAESDDGRIVGYAWIGRRGAVPSLGICVEDAWQEVGVGRALMERLVAAAKNGGKSGIQLTVMADNPRAVALYESVGFIIDRDEPDPMGPSYHMTLQFA